MGLIDIRQIGYGSRGGLRVIGLRGALIVVKAGYGTLQAGSSMSWLRFEEGHSSI